MVNIKLTVILAFTETISESPTWIKSVVKLQSQPSQKKQELCRSSSRLLSHTGKNEICLPIAEAVRFIENKHRVWESTLAAKGMTEVWRPTWASGAVFRGMAELAMENEVFVKPCTAPDPTVATRQALVVMKRSAVPWCRTLSLGNFAGAYTHHQLK